jgi:hypothetical protein
MSHGAHTSVGYLSGYLKEIMVPDISKLLRHVCWRVAPTPGVVLRDERRGSICVAGRSGVADEGQTMLFAIVAAREMRDSGRRRMCLSPPSI